MQTALSLPDDRYERAEQAAQRLDVNRSQLYARALTTYLQDIGADPVTERLNELATEHAKKTDDSRIVGGDSSDDRLRHWEW